MRKQHESHASIHRKASREIDRQLMNRDIAAIWDAVWCATYDGKIYSYGTLAHCEKFIEGLGKRAKVRPLTDKEKASLARHKKQAYGNP